MVLCHLNVQICNSIQVLPMLITGQWDDPVLIQQKYIVADAAYHCTVTPSNRIPLYDCLDLPSPDQIQISHVSQQVSFLGASKIF